MEKLIRKAIPSDAFLMTYGDQGITPELGYTAEQIMVKAIESATDAWSGFVGDKLIAIWGITTGSLLSREAYLWVQCCNDIEKYQFVFAKSSREVVRAIAQATPLIYGRVDNDAENSKRWLKWLGFNLGAPRIEGKMLTRMFWRDFSENQDVGPTAA